MVFRRLVGAILFVCIIMLFWLCSSCVNVRVAAAATCTATSTRVAAVCAVMIIALTTAAATAAAAAVFAVHHVYHVTLCTAQGPVLRLEAQKGQEDLQAA
jgi:hypothetical protein